MSPSRLAVALAFELLAFSGRPAAARRPRIFRVCNGSTHPCPGHARKTIAQAVKRAKQGDWILVWPGVYHEKQTDEAGVLITTPNVHLRGMDRNLVIVDGSNGTAAEPCPAAQDAQDFTARNGVEAFKVDGVHIENLTVCNYLANGDNGNEIWWNGGDGSGQIGMGSYGGAFLNATSMYYESPDGPMGMYGIFVSNARGPGVISDSYASNMGDSDYYVGACPDCNATLTHVHAQNGALGYSGTNAGGHLLIEDSEWDNNKTGIVPSSLNNDDAPPPQDGRCPGGTGSCTLIQRNYIHDNNNVNVPAAGLASTAPSGIGIEIVGGEYDTMQDNVVVHHGMYGIVTHDYPDTETPPPIAHCQGGTEAGGVCTFTARGSVIRGNTLQDNGFYGNPGNGDLANESSSTPRNCFYGNSDPNGLTSDPAMIETVDGPPCDQPGTGSGTVLGQLACAAGIIPCPPGTSYPQPTQVEMMPLSRQDPMPDPCVGIPRRTRWCPYTGPRS